MITDGGHFSQAIHIGSIEGLVSTINCELGEDGLKAVTLCFEAESLALAALDEEYEIVIDSGQIVFCSESDFKKNIASHRQSYDLMSSINKVHKYEGVVALLDDSEHCVGIVVNPPFGDGTYFIRTHQERERRTVAVIVDESV